MHGFKWSYGKGISSERWSLGPVRRVAHGGGLMVMALQLVLEHGNALERSAELWPRFWSRSPDLRIRRGRHSNCRYWITQTSKSGVAGPPSSLDRLLLLLFVSLWSKRLTDWLTDWLAIWFAFQAFHFDFPPHLTHSHSQWPWSFLSLRGSNFRRFSFSFYFLVSSFDFVFVFDLVGIWQQWN